MRRRQGFTLVELLVAMALIIFIMAILSQAFVAAMTTSATSKPQATWPRSCGATPVLQRDLAADHFEGKKRLSEPELLGQNGPP